MKYLLWLATYVSVCLSAVQAAERPVVIELFTSQGCSSCPPADKLLEQLASRDDVIPLALHIDYWDYIGWKDQFADPRHTERQRQYAYIGQRSTVYTPQMIINGDTSIVGVRAMDLADAIQRHKRDPEKVTLNIGLDDTDLAISASSKDVREPMLVHLLRYQPHRQVRVLRGENAGHYLNYTNIVQDMQTLARWTGEHELKLKAQVQGDLPVVILVQGEQSGHILAAARLR